MAAQRRLRAAGLIAGTVPTKGRGNRLRSDGQHQGRGRVAGDDHEIGRMPVDQAPHDSDRRGRSARPRRAGHRESRHRRRRRRSAPRAGARSTSREDGQPAQAGIEHENRGSPRRDQRRSMERSGQEIDPTWSDLLTGPNPVSRQAASNFVPVRTTPIGLVPIQAERRERTVSSPTIFFKCRHPVRAPVRCVPLGGRSPGRKQRRAGSARPARSSPGGAKYCAGCASSKDASRQD